MKTTHLKITVSLCNEFYDEYIIKKKTKSLKVKTILYIIKTEQYINCGKMSRL